MNVSKQKLKNIFQSLFKLRRDRDPSGFLWNPYRDWKIILALFTLGLIVVVTFDAYVFFSLQREAAGEASATATSTSLNRKGLTDALLLYEEKAKGFDETLNSRAASYTEVPDPSR